MSLASSQSAPAMRLVVGSACNALCIWEAGVVRSAREARFLATHGCAASDDSQSAAMRAFLRTCAQKSGDRLSAVEMLAGRVYVLATDHEAHAQLAELRELAHEFGLSYLDATGVVHVRLAVQDQLPIASLLRLVAAGAAARAVLSDDRWRLTIRGSRGSLVASVYQASRTEASALRLLGFRASRTGAWQRILEDSAYASARALTRTLQACFGADLQFDVTLMPPSLAIPLDRSDAHRAIDSSTNRRST